MPLSLIKKTGLALLAVPAMLVCSQAWSQAHVLSPDVLFEQISPSIWVVITFDAQNRPIATGTSVVIGANRMITNCHVLAKASSVKVRNGDVLLSATLEFPDVERDLCQIKVANLKAPVVRIADMAGLRVGQKVYAIGAPKALDETMSDGLLSALRRDKDGKLHYIQTSAPIAHGSSGGGLFNDKGELIGITTLGVDASIAQNIAFALPADWIREVPQRAGIALAKANVGSSQSEPIAIMKEAPPAPAAPSVRQAPPPVAAAPLLPPKPVPASTPRTAPGAKPAPMPIPTPTQKQAPSLPIVKWNGLMSCDARDDLVKKPAYQARFEMDVSGTSVNIYRKNDTVVETLTGQIANNMLDLRGVGYLKNDPGVLWQFKFNGDFPAQASIFSGKGDMLVGGNSIRRCDLVMTRI